MACLAFSRAVRVLVRFRPRSRMMVAAWCPWRSHHTRQAIPRVVGAHSRDHELIVALCFFHAIAEFV
eukprot:6211768-Pleurochrysis_carterae.AAC.1